MDTYEKAYKAVLQTATQWIKDGCTDKERICLECVFPELRESDSEDEMVRKELISALMRQRDSFGAKEPHANNMILPGFTMKVGKILAYLEKQKENPKSADSIPADCTSDVKCEDRWHKVTDSMPDNPREVLCKDEAGNYFIGRYYVGEGWDISNYDAEDKPHHLNPPVSKWIDFPSEKQKEQKSVDNKKVEMTEFEQSVYNLCPVLGIEEAKATASDLLELAKKTLLKTGKVVLTSNYPEGCSFEDGFHLGYNEGFNTKQEEQKPVECIDFDNEFENQISHLLASVLNGEYEYNEGFVKYAAQSLLGFAKNEQKPAEWGEGDEFHLGVAIRMLKAKQEDGQYAQYILDETETWLKSLRPSWKPSEGQIGALERWLLDNKFKGDSRYVYPIFESLYNDLKKLM